MKVGINSGVKKRYLQIKMNDQGLSPSRSNLICGLKLNRLPPTDRFEIVAGFPSEKVGMNENPLLVTLKSPFK